MGRLGVQLYEVRKSQIVFPGKWIRRVDEVGDYQRGSKDQRARNAPGSRAGP